MKLVTFRTDEWSTTHAGVVRDGEIIALAYPTLLELLRDPHGLANAREADGETFAFEEVQLLSPIPEPPSVRDFYAFEQPVKSARTKRGPDLIPEWYEIP